MNTARLQKNSAMRLAMYRRHSPFDFQLENQSVHEKLLMIDTVILGPTQPSLVDGEISHKEIWETLGPLGNTGARDLYRKWVEEVLVEIEWLWSDHTRKERRQREEIPAAAAAAYAKRFPGEKSA